MACNDATHIVPKGRGPNRRDKPSSDSASHHPTSLHLISPDTPGGSADDLRMQTQMQASRLEARPGLDLRHPTSLRPFPKLPVVCSCLAVDVELCDGNQSRRVQSGNIQGDDSLTRLWLMFVLVYFQLMSVTRCLHIVFSPSLSPAVASGCPSHHPCLLVEAQGFVLLHNRSHPRLPPSLANHQCPLLRPVRWT